MSSSLARLGAVSSLLLLLYSLSTLLVVGLIGGPPETINECYAMLAQNRLHGLLRLDVLTVFAMPLYFVLFYALFRALRPVHVDLALLATAFVFIGVTLFLAAPSVFSFVRLSDQYALATAEPERLRLLAAGEALLATDIWHGTGPQLGGLLTQTGALVISFLMLKSAVFAKLTAYTGIATHGLDLAHVVLGFLAPQAAVMLMFVAGPLYLLWFPLVARDLLKHPIGNREQPKAARGADSPAATYNNVLRSDSSNRYLPVTPNLLYSCGQIARSVSGSRLVQSNSMGG
jgi:hypothetical protein